MRQSFVGLVVATCLCGLMAVVSQSRAADEDGFELIFDGKSLEGWDGNPDFWRAEDGTITGQTTAQKPTKGNTFIIWRKGELGDFELKLEYKIVGGNSGIQYRSFEVPNEKWVIGGYQADFEAGDTYSGICYGERYRGILALRGQKTVIGDDHKPKVVGNLGDTKEIQAKIKKEDWNEYHVTAKGFDFVHRINGVVTCEVTDEDKKDRRATGVLALQLHAGPPMKVQFRNIRLKRLKADEAKPADAKKGAAIQPGQSLVVRSQSRTSPAVAPTNAADGAKKKVVFVAGRPSHGYGAHEHYAGCVLLAKALNSSNCNIQADVVKNGWPSDASVFDGADAIVMYSDGGGGHMVNPHLKQVDALTKKGVGVACLHYAVEVPAGESGDRFLDWIGGYFEMNWSVNPHWTANFTKFPDHPITRGVQPFSINDEWYYHMRFRPNMEGVTPILTDLPSDDTLRRPDGPHSGNPHVRQAIAKKEPQHVAWAAERQDGGRGFGFTGGHDHWNWGDPNFRKLVLNAIVWIAKGEVPAKGVESSTLSVEQLQENQDYPAPANFNPNGIRDRLKLPAGSGKTSAAAPAGPAPKPLFTSKVVTTQTPGHAETVDIDITGAKQLFLVATDGGNGFGCDWADWAEPRLVGPSGEKKLTDLRWKSAAADWGNVNVNKNADGKSMRIAGKDVAYGIGTHANSVIEFDLPEGYTRFQARVGLDNGGTDQQGGGASSVQFFVYSQRPPATVATVAGAASASREPADAISGLDVAEGLEATLFSSEPQVLNLTNLDIDSRGRVWVCEVVNYRGHNGKRPEGDRILILEDVDHDGRADKTTVFYQGRDIDSAMGICVLGNKVIVSCSPNILVFTDENGDDKPDQKEVLFSKTGQAQHDHSAHSFLFGPDGKYYWNFGNTGQRVCDKDGNPIVDLAGNQVVDNGKPYYGGMPFRCNPDGSQFEVLAHNFRNNYEVTVDSFGTLWQSDNDDDGNRGVRINYVMEFGNYGYRDELTGAGWNTPRTNLETEIPLRHWHLNDPGVVPNLLQTGAGSPTGITVYEGRLLPKKFWDQVIHCDAGPNVVRAYPATVDGAGYKAEMVDVLKGARDNWFRPADVCVAPDGSLFVTDWYDPGVGGHAQGDSIRGRLFRVAPPGTKYEVPKLDFNSPEGAVAALINPNAAVRFLAWTALQKMGDKAEPALKKLWSDSDNPRHRARALWALGKLTGQGGKWVETASSDKDANLRIVAIRLARQLDANVGSLIARLAKDPSPQVRRECAIALRLAKSPEAPQIWAELAAAHDGSDRWYLEALGIGAEKQWDAALDAWLNKVGDKVDSPAGRDIVWRSRSAKTPDLLARIIRDPRVSAGELPRYFRAFDYQSGPAKDAALVELAFGKADSDPERAKLIASESLKRVPPLDLEKNPQHAAAMERLVSQTRGTSQFVELVNKFNLSKYYGDLLKMAQEKPDDQSGVDAIIVLLHKNQNAAIETALRGKELAVAAATARALGNSADARIAGLLLPIVKDAKQDLEVRRQATRGLASTRNGAQQLIGLAKDQALDAGLVSAASFQLHAAPWKDLKDEIARLFPVPPAKDRNLPPVADLVKMKGDAGRGSTLFAKTAECSKCHVVNGQGKEVGPNLSEIGGKLSRQAFFESILYPSAGIAHSYETYVVVLNDGNSVTGIKTSETPDSVTLKTADALLRTFAKSDVDELVKQNISLMPADLQKTMTTQDLVDVVEYLTTLKK